MLFSSLEFLYLFLPIAVAFYFLAPRRARNLVLLIESLAFYAWGEISLLWVMLFVILLNFVGGLLIERVRARRTVLCVTVALNIAVLAFFKYTDFFLENLGFSPLGIVLPLGISFYIFQAMSYVCDVYRGVSAQKSLVSFGAYVTMFPQLVAGPIVRYTEVDEALRSRSTRLSDIADGIRVFSVGLAKKVLLANNAGKIREIFLSAGEGYITVVGEWAALILFAFQIYFDFGGYSDMAVGLGKIFGFSFPKNFDYPYVSRSITEFWRRWHITLSSWFREYVYITLGGNRCSRARMYFNLFVVWTLTGLWHGAEWCFTLWGIYFFLLLVLEKAFLLGALEKLPQIVGRIYALFFIMIGWFIFTCEEPAEFLHFGRLFGLGVDGFINGFVIYELSRFLPLIIIMAVGSTPTLTRFFCKAENNLPRVVSVLRAILPPVAILLSTAALAGESYNPFLYFRF